MATPFTYLLVAMATVATVYSAVAVPANARADELGAKTYPPAELAELVKWHSDVTVISESCVSPQRTSALVAIDPENSMAYRVLHGADGLPHAAKDGFGSSAAFFNPPKDDRKSALGSAGTR